MVKVIIFLEKYFERHLQISKLIAFGNGIFVREILFAAILPFSEYSIRCITS